MRRAKVSRSSSLAGLIWENGNWFPALRKEWPVLIFRTALSPPRFTMFRNFWRLNGKLWGEGIPIWKDPSSCAQNWDLTWTPMGQLGEGRGGVWYPRAPAAVFLENGPLRPQKWFGWGGGFVPKNDAERTRVPFLLGPSLPIYFHRSQ